MKILTRVALGLGLGNLLVGGVFSVPAAGLPVAGKGPGATTLLVYSGTRTAYALNDRLEFLQMQLRRVATRVEAIPASLVDTNALAAADYLVVFCPQPRPELPSNFLHALALTNRPVLWVGFGAEAVQGHPRLTNQFQCPPEAAAMAIAEVNYRGRSWAASFDPWIPMTLATNASAEVLMRATTPRPASVDGAATEHPVAWRIGAFTMFAAVPGPGAGGWLFGDLLLDFYGVREMPPAQVLLRIEDYRPDSNHREFRRMADYLHHRGIPFGVAVIAAVRDPATGKVEDLESQPEFAAALRYAQQRGGRVILKGGVFEGSGGEFWDTARDAARPDDSPPRTRDRLHRAVRQLLKHGLLPLAWETPGYAASRAAYAEIARVFSTAVEQVQLADTTQSDRCVPSALTRDRHGRTIVPENLGFALTAPTNAFAGIRAEAATLLALRGTVGGCYLHAYQSLEKLTALVEVLESFRVPFLDLADLDAAVELPEALLLSGDAERTVTLSNALVRWKTFDRSGKLLAEETESERSSGERVFRRRAGDCQLIEFVTAQP